MMDAEAAVDYLVDARMALEKLSALNGCDAWHDAMRGVSLAARALGVSTNNLVALTEARRRVRDEFGTGGLDG
jgi:hypothetical protein